jgi:hypothetical protein
MAWNCSAGALSVFDSLSNEKEVFSGAFTFTFTSTFTLEMVGSDWSLGSVFGRERAHARKRERTRAPFSQGAQNEWRGIAPQAL